MPTKNILVLANSIKKQHRCVAGREIVKHPDGKEGWGEWIRPVTHHDEGAVSLPECRLQDGTVPLPFNVIQVPVATRENNRAQPENWYVQPGVQWRRIAIREKDVACDLIETPENLWLEPGVKQDRVSARYLLSQRTHQSLYLIQPDSFCFKVEINHWEDVEKKRIRGVFGYNGQNYDFSMTDPVIRKKYFPHFAAVPTGMIEYEWNETVLICASLTHAFNGYHYKIIATMIEG